MVTYVKLTPKMKEQNTEMEIIDSTPMFSPPKFR